MKKAQKFMDKIALELMKLATKLFCHVVWLWYTYLDKILIRQNIQSKKLLVILISTPWSTRINFMSLFLKLFKLSS